MITSFDICTSTNVCFFKSARANRAVQSQTLETDAQDVYFSYNQGLLFLHTSRITGCTCFLR